MKYLFLFLLLLSVKAGAQTIKGSIKWKNVKGVEFDYTGELLNGKPHGIGYARAKDGIERIFGYFKNGKQNGKAATWTYGYKRIADYKDGYAYGPGAEAAPAEFKVGEFDHGVFSGKLIVVSDDDIYVLENGESFQDGRIVRITANGSYLLDGYLINGKMNGPGSYLVTEEGKPSIGTWKDDELVNNYTGNYSSFLQSKNLKLRSNEKLTIICSDVTTDNKLKDTCFVYEKDKNQQNFGYYDKGIMRHGIFVVNEKSYILGNWDENGEQEDYCVSYDVEKDLFSAGNYKKGKPNGRIVSFNNKGKNDMIYIGEATENEMTGEAVFLKDKLIYAGKLNKGLLDGKGKIIYPDGRIITGDYANGKLVMPDELFIPGGKKLNIKPKDLNTAINFLLKEWENNFSNIKSEELAGDFIGEYNCLYYFPGGVSLIITGRKDLNGNPHAEFSSEIKKDRNYALVKKEYENLCRQLTACNITSLTAGKALKLIPQINNLPEDKQFESTASFFSLPDYTGKKADPPLIRVMVESLYDGYKLTVDIISKWK